jgi:16S rRNA (guanine966-N2)-methyltransferase
MRIVGGSHRGRVLQAPEGRDTRPTGDRARQALFNILEHGAVASGGSILAGARVLDIFAGTGALGLEALSRGAVHAGFFEQAPAALKILKANIAGLREEPRTRILAGDATRPPKAPAGAAASLVFLDPPYHTGAGTAALTALGSAGWLAPAALAVLELAADEPVVPQPGADILEERRYGAARLVFLRLPGEGP